MANIKSARKRIRINERQRQRNMAVKSRMKTHLKGALRALDQNDAEAVKAALPKALSEIDRAASKGVIHKNNAARKKARLQRRAGALTGQSISA